MVGISLKNCRALSGKSLKCSKFLFLSSNIMTILVSREWRKLEDEIVRKVFQESSILFRRSKTLSLKYLQILT